MAQDERLRIAVFIDFDNIEIGVKNTLNASFDAGLVLEALKERGEVVSKTAYSDWQRAGGYSRMLTQHAIRMVQRNLTPGGDKNGADINLALDALEMAFTHPHINAFVIVGGDSDFISLVEKLKQYDKKVFIVGGRQFTSGILQRNCHEFMAYENLVGASAVPASGGRRQSERGVRVERASIDQAIPLVTRALKVLSEREDPPQLGLLKTTMLQLDSTFSERTYGAGSFRDFAQKLEKLGVLKVIQSKGGWIVVAGDGAVPPVEMPPAPADETISAPPPAPATAASSGNGSGPRAVPAPVLVSGTPADGVREFKQILAAAKVRRWPMYLRNVKQTIRQVSASFDERAYGFANLVDLLRAAHKDGIVRVDRDRQGVIRVFQGTTAPASAVGQDIAQADDQRTDLPSDDAAAIAADAADVATASAAAEIGVPIFAALPSDTTADDEQPAAAPAEKAPAPRRRRKPAATSGTPRPRTRKRT